jgi:hypothetical protein
MVGRAGVKGGLGDLICVKMCEGEGVGRAWEVVKVVWAVVM